jgi:DNA-binding PadR family transcriptional regulator
MFHHTRHHRRHHLHGRHFGPWAWKARFFESGDIPLALLSLLVDGPKHGYELMKELERRSGGLYKASAGTVYPTLQQLQDEELVISESADGARRVYSLTDAGRERLDGNADRVAAIWERSQDDEWGGWADAMDPSAAEVMRPAFRLMRVALGSVARSNDPDRADRVREILKRARREIQQLGRED